MSKEHKQKRSREIMKQIHDILWNDWDPIGVREIGGPEDEYDSYIGGVYRLLSEDSSEAKLLDHLHQMETDTIGLSPGDRKRLVPVVKKLMEIDVSL